MPLSQAQKKIADLTPKEEDKPADDFQSATIKKTETEE